MKQQLKQYRQQMESQIQDLVREGVTDRYHHPLFLVAPDGDLEKSYYLQLVARKMEALGLRSKVVDPNQFFQTELGSDWPMPFIADTDQLKLPENTLQFAYGFNNIDQGEPVSCCAEAILDAVDTVFCGEFGGAGKNATVIGRGYAVQGLANELLKRDFTVTICHSKTDDLVWHTVGANLLVFAAPKVNDTLEQSGAELVVDMNQIAPHMRVEIDNYITGSDIGPITILHTILRYCRYENMML